MSSKENFPGLMHCSNSQGMAMRPGDGKVSTRLGNNRRALGAIDKNIIVDPSYPCALYKRDSFKDNKKSGILVHRPNTRNFAKRAEIEQKQAPQEVEPLPQAAPIPFESEDCIIWEADEDVPSFVQHTEAMLEDIYRMDVEVEMEDISHEVEELVMDIDSSDKKNPFAVTEYIDEIYTYYKKAERLSCVPPNYMEKQPDINERMRAILIDWLIEVHYKFELMEETLYLTVNLIDRFLAVKPMVRKKLQLVGATALLLACKYEEVSVPIVEDLILISDKAYSRQEALEMEKLMINTLQFNLSLPTPYVFMRRFLKAAQSDKKLELLSFFLIELCLVEYEMLQFPPSLLAAAAIFTGLCTVSGQKQWSITCETHTNYTKNQLLDCAKMMVTFHQRAGTGKITGVHKKYSTSKYGYAANVEPAVFLLAEGEM